MNQTTINAFAQAVDRVFKMMLATPISLGDAYAVQHRDTPHDVSGIIGFSGALRGNLVMSFPRPVAETFYALMAGLPAQSIDNEDLCDAIGELVNMVAGNAKTVLNSGHASISTPTVVIGKGIRVLRPREIPTIALPCRCSAGDFAVEITVQQ